MFSSIEFLLFAFVETLPRDSNRKQDFLYTVHIGVHQLPL